MKVAESYYRVTRVYFETFSSKISCRRLSQTLEEAVPARLAAPWESRSLKVDSQRHSAACGASNE